MPVTLIRTVHKNCFITNQVSCNCTRVGLVLPPQRRGIDQDDSMALIDQKSYAKSSTYYLPHSACRSASPPCASPQHRLLGRVRREPEPLHDDSAALPA